VKKWVKNKKGKGSRRERLIRDHAFEGGAIDVVKSAASLGPFDLILIFPVRAVLVQVKGNAWPRRPERETLDAIAAKLDRRLYRVVSIRVDDGERIPGRGSVCYPPAISVRVHNGPGVDADACSWNELIGTLGGNGLRVV
jgi:hypothetical protein